MTEALTKAGQEHLAVKLRDYAALLRSAAPLADSTGEIPAAVLSHPATALFSAAYLPVEYGGGITDSGTGKRIECSARLCAYIVEEIALGDPGLCCALPGPSLTFPVLNAFGNSDQKRKYFSLFCGEQPVWGGFAITEPHAGTDAFALKTRAAKVAGGYVLNGTKCFITNGERASFFILFATINANLRQFGQRAFIVDRSFPGFSVGTRERMLGLRVAGLTEIVLSDCFVPDENLLRDQAGRAHVPAIEGPRVAWKHCRIEVSSIAVASARTICEELRSQYGIRLDDLERDVQIGRLLCQNAADRVDAGHSAAYEVAVAKAFTAGLAANATLRAIQELGASALKEGSLFERLFRATKAFDIMEGTGEIQREHIAKEFLI